MNRVQYLGVAILLPAVLAHELTHAVFALPFGRVEKVTLVPPEATLIYPSGTSRFWIRLANLAPTLVGTVIGLPVGWWILTHLALNLAIIGYLVGSWMVYTLPVSERDRRPFKHAEPN